MNGSGSLNRSRLSPNPPGAHDSSSSYNAALKGASLAFQKSTPKQLPTTPNSSRNVDHGALLAATTATSSRDHSRTVSRQTTGGSNTGGGGNAGLEIDERMMSQSASHHLQPSSQRSYGTPSRPALASKPSKQTVVDARSPSFIAATIAASRSSSPTHYPTLQSHPISQQPAKRQQPSVNSKNSATSSVTSLDLGTDTTSIPSANALISMFEKRDDDTDPIKKEVPESNTRKSLGAKPSPRPLTPPRTMSPIVKNELSPSRLASSAAWQRAASISPTPSIPASTRRQEKQPESQNRAGEVKGQPPAPPPTRTKNKSNISTSQPKVLESKGKPRASTPPAKTVSHDDTVVLSPQPRRSTSQKILLNDIHIQDAVPEGETSLPTKSKPQYPRPDPSPPENNPRRDSVSSDDSFVSASSAPSPHAGSPERGRSRPSSPDTIRPRRPPSAQTMSSVSTGRPPPLPRRPTQPTPNLPLEALTDAIMAGSLASSRMTPSTSQTPPPKPPSRRQTPHMRQTLRRPPSKSDDEETHTKKRKPMVKLGGNKHIHHEGARKRWREEITARERKRYEGVWASNRGLLLVSPDRPLNQQQSEKEKLKEQMVANVIVRDIWARSRLPFDELAEVWDLVDRRGVGYLDRAEFVVGMWLIDQRLRGRKIPRKVTDSVWGSARGVRVAPPKHGK
ncbi:hypothetical protein M426DRAFT_324533 [Hypoxylon sp. CI-4A]|nr:hypothetical protein M426DRAFT_324533 [Hypoxylon sp. CI-4A]